MNSQNITNSQKGQYLTEQKEKRPIPSWPWMIFSHINCSHEKKNIFKNTPRYYWHQTSQHKHAS